MSIGPQFATRSEVEALRRKLERAISGASIVQHSADEDGVQSFIELADVPQTYAGATGELPYVNAAEDGLEFNPYVTVSPTTPILTVRNLTDAEVDCVHQFAVGATPIVKWTYGLDDSDGDGFKICAATSLNDTDYLKYAAGHVYLMAGSKGADVSIEAIGSYAGLLFKPTVASSMLTMRFAPNGTEPNGYGSSYEFYGSGDSTTNYTRFLHVATTVGNYLASDSSVLAAVPIIFRVGTGAWNTLGNLLTLNATNITATQQLISTLAIGTAPFATTSTTVCTNLNAGLVDGYHHDQSLLTTAAPSFDHLHLTIADGTAPMVITSTTVCTNLNADLWDGYHSFQSETLEPTGFPNRTDTTLSWSDANKRLTITGTNFKVWYKGVEYTLNTDTSDIADATGLYYFYYEISGATLNLTNSTIDPGLTVPLVALVYWNTVAGMDKGLCSDERHGTVMDHLTHRYLHNTVGTRFETGLVGTFADTTFDTTLGYILDEDIRFTIGATTTCRVLYLDGSVNWKWTAAQTLYYYTGLYYDSGTTLTVVDANKYVAYWIFATGDITTPIVSIMGQRQDTQLATARTGNTYEGLTLGVLPYKEMKLLYRVLLRQTGTPYVETADYRSVSNLSSGTYVATLHSALTGLTAGDDHTQYAFCKIHATDPPGVDDDITLYREGTVWIEQDADKVYICADNADGAAVWREIWSTDIPTAVTIGSAYIYRVGGTDVAVADGGTGKSSFTLYAIPYASGTTTIGEIAIGTATQALTVNAGANGYTWASVLSNPMADIGDMIIGGVAGAPAKLVDVVVGSYLRSGGVTTAPLWSTLKLPNAATKGALTVATDTNTISELAAVGATTQILVGGGAATIPVWGTDLPTAVTIGGKYIYRADGTDVPVADGGTGASTFTDHGVLYGQAANAIGATAEGATGTYLAGTTGNAPSFATLNQAAVDGLKTTDGPTHDHIHLTSGQVGFPAAQVASADVNTLDDYEEGTWTPALQFGGNSTGMTGTFTGTYTKIGRLVYITCRIALTDRGSSTGDANIVNLPFSISDEMVGLADPVNMAGLTAGGSILGFAAATTIYLGVQTTTSRTNLTHSNFTNTSNLFFCATYIV